MSELQIGRNSLNMGSRVLAAIFDNLERIDSNFFAYTKVEGKEDIVNLFLNERGDFDPGKASKSVLLCEVDQNLLPALKSEFVKSGIPFCWQSYVEPAKEKDQLAKVHAFLAFPKSEEIIVNSMIDEFVKIKPERDPMEPVKLLNWIISNEDGLTKAAGIDVDKELYDYITRAGLLSIPRAEIGEDTVNNTVKLRIPWEMGDGVLATIKMAETLYTGEFKRQEEKQSIQFHNTMDSLLSKAKDDRYNAVIVNGESPSQYVRIDRDGFKFYIDTESGHNLVARADRSERTFEQSLYNILRDFKDHRELAGSEKDTEEKLHQIQSQGQQIHTLTVEERVCKLKHEHIDNFIQAAEIIGTTYQRTISMQEQYQEMDKGRLKDDAYKIENRIDELSAAGLGNSAAAGDLRGDLTQIKGMILSSLASEVTKDLSDLYDTNSWKNFLTEKLCLDAHTEKYKTDRLDLFKEMIDSVSKEDPEVQFLFRKEFAETIKEVFDHDYRYQSEEMTLEEVDLKLELVTHERNAELSLSR